MALGGRLLLAARCAGGFGNSPKGVQAARLKGHCRGHVGLIFPAVFLRYEPTPGESWGAIRAAAFVGEV